MLSNHLILCHPLLILPSVFLNIKAFSSESALHIRWPKYWSFSFSISPSNEYSGLIFFKMDWLDLLAVQRTLKSFLQYHSSKASIIWCSAFFMVQLSHLYVTIGKTIALTICTSVSKVISLLFNTLSRFIIGFLPRSKHLLMAVPIYIPINSVGGLPVILGSRLWLGESSLTSQALVYPLRENRYCLYFNNQWMVGTEAWECLMGVTLGDAA